MYHLMTIVSLLSRPNFSVQQLAVVRHSQVTKNRSTSATRHHRFQKGSEIWLIRNIETGPFVYLGNVCPIPMQCVFNLCQQQYYKIIIVFNYLCKGPIIVSIQHINFIASQLQRYSNKLYTWYFQKTSLRTRVATTNDLVQIFRVGHKSWPLQSI